MKTARRFNPAAGAAAILVFMFLAGPAVGQELIDEQHKLAPDGRVNIENISGSVVVIGWDRDEIKVTGILGEG